MTLTAVPYLTSFNSLTMAACDATSPGSPDAHHAAGNAKSTTAAAMYAVAATSQSMPSARLIGAS